jgi:hypothetical protein
MYRRLSLTLKLKIFDLFKFVFLVSQKGKNVFSGSVAYLLKPFLNLAQMASPVDQRNKISVKG